MLVAIFLCALILVFLQVLLNGNVYQLSLYLKSVLDSRQQTPTTTTTNTRPTTTSRRSSRKVVEEKENGAE